jgi:hypothetical protein
MRAKLYGGTFDGQEVDIENTVTEIPTDGGAYVFAQEFETLRSPDGMAVAGSKMPVFKFVANEVEDK